MLGKREPGRPPVTARRLEQIEIAVLPMRPIMAND